MLLDVAAIIEDPEIEDFVFAGRQTAHVYDPSFAPIINAQFAPLQNTGLAPPNHAVPVGRVVLLSVEEVVTIVHSAGVGPERRHQNARVRTLIVGDVETRRAAGKNDEGQYRQ
jgi:hypothetical protein